MAASPNNKCIPSALFIMLSLFFVSITSAQETTEEQLETRGIAGFRKGHASPAEISKTISDVKTGYGDKYGDLVNTFYTMTKKVGMASGSYEKPDSVSNLTSSLEVQIDVVQELKTDGTYRVQSVNNGDILNENSYYKIVFSCNQPCYLYIVQLDATGKMDPIFPSRYHPESNPITSSNQYSIPQNNDWFRLDNNRGVETIYFIASRARKPELETVFQKIERHNMNLVRQAPVSMNVAVPITRGIGGIRPGQSYDIDLSDGKQDEYSSEVFSSVKADLIATRWFYHK